MININNVVLVGRLTKDPEIRKTSSGISVMACTVAVNRRGKKDEADFIQVVVWKQGAEYLNSYAHKGDLVSVEGSIRTRKYEDRNGKTVWVTEVNANNVSLMPKQSTDSSYSQDSQPGGYQTTPDALGIDYSTLPF